MSPAAWRAGLLLLLAGCAAPEHTSATGSRGIPLANASFEIAPRAEGECPPGWYCITHAGSPSHRYRMERADGAAGRAAFCTDRVQKDNWALLNQHVPAEAFRGERLRLTMSIRVNSEPSAPGAGPFLLAEALDSNAVMHVQKLVVRTSGWERIAVEGVVPANAWRLQVGALFDADGPVCVEDVRLEVLPHA